MLHIKNASGEKLDTLVEGNDHSRVTIVFVHGFATDKHETAHYFDDLSGALQKDFRIVRFDFSGCGKSEGRSEDINYEKHADDLRAVLAFVKNEFGGTTYIFAHSMGCFVTALLNPEGIAKTIFTSIPNNNPQYITDRLVQYFGSRAGSRIDFKGISVFPRSSGALQKIGPSFWHGLSPLKPAELVAEFAQHTQLLIIHPSQDEIVGKEYLEEYRAIPGVTVEWIEGSHSFENLEERKKLIERIQGFFR